MIKKSLILKSLGVLAIASLVTTGCGKEITLKNGEKPVVSLEKVKITSDSLYKQIRDKYGIAVLVDMIDHELFDKKYKSNDDEKKYIDEKVTEVRNQYGGNDVTFQAAMEAYYGVKTEKELRKIFALEHKRERAVIDQVGSTIDKEEIQDYYDKEISGKITARHILIKPETTSSMSDEEVEKAEKAALNKAKDIIKKLDKGGDFKKLAKENSNDTANAKEGGLLAAFDHNDNMDKSFFRAAKELKKGKYSSEPVKSEFGYHIILKEKEEDTPKLEDVKKLIQDNMARERLDNDQTLFQKSLRDIREKKKIKFTDDSLKKDYEDLMDKLIKNN